MDSSELKIRFAGPQNRRELICPWMAQTLQDLADELLPEHGGYTVVVNGSIMPKDQWDRPLTRGAEIDFVPDFGDIVSLVIWLATAIGAPAAATAIVGPITWGMVYSAIAYIGTSYLVNSLMPKPKMPDPMGGGSPAYTWDPKTTQEEGRPKPRSYGTFRAHGNIVNAYTEPSEPYADFGTYRKQSMYALVAFGEGPVASITDVRINGRPYSDHADCTCETKRGLLTQTNVSFFDKTRLQFRTMKKITNSDGAWTWRTPDNDFDDIEIDIRFNLWYRHKSGSAGYTNLNIKIEIAVADSESWTEIVDEYIADCQTDLLWKKYTVSDYYAITRGTRYELRFTKLSGDTDHPRSKNEMWVESVKEVIDVAFTYPGLILVGLSGIASEDLPGFMDVSAVLGNRIVHKYDGEAWSLAVNNNPAWAIWDIFTQPVISGDGAGTPYAIEEYEGSAPSRIDEDDVYALALFCDTLVPDAEGVNEKRITFNGIFDTESNTWTAALQVCQVARCLPLWDGNKIVLAINKAKTRDGILSVGNILEGSFEEVFAPKIDAASEIEAIFNDSERNYERRVLPFVNRNLTHYQNKLTIDLIGLTKQTEVVRAIKHRLAHNELCRRGLKVLADIDALRFQVGDLVGIQHDVPDWNALKTRGGGRLVGFTPGETDDIVILDKDVEKYILPGVTYELMVRVHDTDTATIKTVKSVDGSSITIDGKFTGTSPRDNDLWALGKENLVLKDFTIEAIERSGDQQYKLTMLEYNSAVYDKDAEIPVVQVPAPTPAKVDRRFPGDVTIRDLRRQAVAAALEFPTVDIPLVTNLAWTDNSPVAGSIAWSAKDGATPILLTVAGTVFEITAGNTDKKFVYWDVSNPNTFLGSDTRSDAVGIGKWFVCHNSSGTALEIMSGKLFEGSILRDASVEANAIANNAIEEAKIAADAVTATKIATGAVLESKLADLAVTLAKLAANAVDSTKIVNDAVIEAKIAADAVTAAKIAVGGLDGATGNVAANHIVAAMLQTNCVIAAKIQAGAITTDKIDALAVTAAKIAADTITGAKIAASTITATEIAAGTITATEIAALTILTGNIAADAVTGIKIAADAITAPKINVVGLHGETGRIVVTDVTDANVVTGGINTHATTLIQAGKIIISGATNLDNWSHGLDATKIDGGRIYTDSVTAAQIAANTITANEILGNTITANEIASTTITAAEIASDAIVTSKLAANAASLAKLDLAVQVRLAYNFRQHCVGHWKLNDNAATTVVIDSSDSANNGTLQGGDNTVDKSVTGKVNKAFDFNGIDDNVSIADSAALSPSSAITISCWVDFDTLGEATGIVWKGYNYSIEQSGDRIRFNIWDTDGDQSIANFAEADLEAGWNHIVATFDGVSKIYLNGLLKDTGVAVDNIRDNAADLLIAKRHDAVGNVFFDGKIDNVMIFNMAFGADDIAMLWHNGNGTESLTEVADGAVHTDQLAANTITAGSGIIGDLAVDTLQIAGLAVHTEKLEDNATKILSEAANVAAFEIDDPSYRPINQVTLTSLGGVISVHLEVEVYDTDVGAEQYLEFVRNGHSFFEKNVSTEGDQFISFSCHDTPGAGSVTYGLQGKRGTAQPTYFVRNRFLQACEDKGK